MSTNQTMLTLGAFILFSTLLVAFYRILAQSGDTIGGAQGGIGTITLATTYVELAQGLAFDEMTVDSFVTPTEISHITASGSLGPENPPPTGEAVEADFTSFDDIDDLKGYTIIDNTLQGIVGTYKTTFNVYYVNPLNVDQVSANRTFTKRLDISVLRISPPSVDTLKTSIIMGYFHFD